ncbi:helix-turn-helix domain-containing protein [Ruminiclostridium cellobioparum]|uniref:helix-turn-helix domain-containing protein n=1 Tax=Ruminiclostridium cellobioparum TaxID=29355 RepID=UPI0028AC6D34|nr:helix-turn-helix transcriptional regulator [Ruminiclostridium cellobioparum]
MRRDNTKLSLRLKELREEKRLLQKDIAKLLNITTSAYGFYEQGKRDPDTEVVRLLADFYSVTSDYILGLTDNKKQHIQKNNNDDSFKLLLKKIENLSDESKKELEKYVDLLNIKDGIDKSKDEMSSTLTKNVL